jgi:homoserine O-acetyltransferase
MATMSDYYSQENHGPFHLHSLGDFTLTSGQVLKDAQIAYATQGTLNAAKDNAVLVTTWYTGTTKIMEQIYIGAGHALDPSKYFIILANQLGSGLSTSPSNSAVQGGAAFPAVSMGDDVNAQHRLVTEAFGLDHLALVFGGSMGAGQALEWACRYPGFAQRVAALAGVGTTRPHAVVIGKIVQDILTSAPGFNGGAYAAADMAVPLRQHALYWTNLAWCPDFLDRKGWEPLGHASLDAFLTDFMTGYFAPMDANNLLAQVSKWQRADVGGNAGGDAKAAYAKVKSKVLLMPISSDQIFPVATCIAEAALIPGARLTVIDGKAGHLGLFAIEPDYMPQINAALSGLLGEQV